MYDDDKLENLTIEDIKIRLSIFIDIKRDILKSMTMFCSIERLMLDEVRNGNILAQINNTQNVYFKRLDELEKNKNS